MQRECLDILVVGAGAFGAVSALELAQRGHQVTILDRTIGPHPSASSTDISKMIRMDYGSDVFYHELADYSLNIWEQWNQEWPKRLYHPERFLVLAAKPFEPGSFEFESERVLRERGYTPERFNAAQLAAKWPAWNVSLYPQGYLSPRGGWAESGAVVSRLLESGRTEGVHFVQGALDEVLSKGSKVSGVSYRALNGSMNTLSVDRVVVAAGAWTPILLPWLEDTLKPVAQPIIHYEVEDPSHWQSPVFPPFAADTSGSGWYGFPSLQDGRLKLGHHGNGRVVDPDSRGEVSEEHLDHARSFLRSSLPKLSDVPVVGTRVCLYCDTFDGDLWIGEDPERSGLIVAAGGSGHGFKFTPMIGKIVGDVLEKRDNRWLYRFDWRERGKPRKEAARLQL